MLDTDYILSEISDILAILDIDEYPETYNYLSGFVADNNMECPSCHDLATDIIKSDRKQPMHRVVFNFLVELYTSEIEDDNADAMNDLGALYYDGYGCEVDYEKAVYYYTMAAEKGNHMAQENLGYCYYYGRVGAPDYEKAYHYFALGALCGQLISLYKIGDMYQNGYYVKKNEEEAFRIYNRVMEIMTEEAEAFVCGPVFLRLGNCFLYGKGTDTNSKTALICYQNAERYLFDMVKNGDRMYSKSLKAAIEGQTKAREKLSAELPEQY